MADTNDRPGVPPRRRRPSREPLRAYAAMRTMRALERLAFSPLSAPELALALQIHPRTARRLLQRLELEDTSSPRSGHGAATTSPAASPPSAAKRSPATSSHASPRRGSRPWPATRATSPHSGFPATPTSSASYTPTPAAPSHRPSLVTRNPRPQPPPARPCSPITTPGATASSPNPYGANRVARSPTPASSWPNSPASPTRPRHRQRRTPRGRPRHRRADLPSGRCRRRARRLAGSGRIGGSRPRRARRQRRPPRRRTRRRDQHRIGVDRTAWSVLLNGSGRRLQLLRFVRMGSRPRSVPSSGDCWFRRQRSSEPARARHCPASSGRVRRWFV